MSARPDPSTRSAGDAAAAAAFWLRPLTALRAELETGDGGLDAADAARRRLTFGANELVLRSRAGALAEWLRRLRHPLVLLLLAACIVSAALGDGASAAIIAAIVAASVALDVVQERRARDAVERLRATVALQATACRDGRWQRLPAAALVPGDLVRLAAGDLVPADVRLVEARDFFVQQALLTGESFPVEKRAGDLGTHDARDPQAKDAADAEAATNAAFMGSSVLTGSATALVCRTGTTTMLGAIADTLRRAAPPTSFDTGLRRLGRLVANTTFVLVVLIVVVHTLAHRPVQQTFLFAVALAVGLTPELLPAIVSVTLARGAVRLAARRVIVKRLAAIQELGSLDVLCTDKTGTLTEGAVRLERHIDVAGHDSARVLELAVLNSRFESGLRSPLDDAIVRHAPAPTTDGWTKLDEVPFGFERRRVSVLVERAGERLIVVKGAPDDVLRACDRVDDAGTPRPLDAAAAARVRERFESLGRDGLRVLAVASKPVAPDHAHAALDDERSLVLAGFCAFADPPKAGAAEALRRLRRDRVRIKVVTGDDERVARHVCAAVGLPVARLLGGAQIERLDDHALAALAPRTDVFFRVTPAHKTRIVRALQRRGHVVGFLGDGINDAPALHDADVGISVDSAVDVAKEAADLILLEHDLGVLHAGVVEGRRTFANTMKYVLMATSSNFGNMASVAGASLFLPFLPLLPTQILLNNLLYDVSELTIPRDAVDAEQLARPQGWHPDFVRRFMLTLGPVSSAFDALTFVVLLKVFDAGEALFRTGWFVESLATQVLVIFVIRTRAAPWRSRPDRWLAATSLGVVAMAALLPFTPLARPLGFVAPPPLLLAAIVPLALAYLGCAELAKRWCLRTTPRRLPAGRR